MDPTKENQPTVNLCGSSGTVDDAPAQLSQQVTCSSSSVISSSPSPSSSSLSSQRQLRSEALRLDIFPEATFQEWLCFLTPRELAASGFFFCGSANQARCTFCHITVVQGGWCRHSPNCPFVKDLRGVEGNPSLCPDKIFLFLMLIFLLFFLNLNFFFQFVENYKRNSLE